MYRAQYIKVQTIACASLPETGLLTFDLQRRRLFGLKSERSFIMCMTWPRNSSFVRIGVGLLVVLIAVDSYAQAQQFPLVQGMGTYTRKVTTISPDAQKYFNQGLALTHGFNHGAAIKSFQEAAKLDPNCAMAHWGI